MANSFNIPERTMNQLASSTNSINVIGGTDGRTSVYEPLVVRVTDAVGDTGVNCTTEKLLDANAVLFVSKQHGKPFTRNGVPDNGLSHIIHQAASTPAVPTDTTVLFPNFDYTTFE